MKNLRIFSKKLHSPTNNILFIRSDRLGEFLLNLSAIKWV